MKDINPAEFIQLKNGVAIDVRSPIEFEEGSIPGAINIPLFTNEERHEIGTLYKQQGQDVARWRAMEIVSPKLPIILGELKRMKEQGKEPVIHCWRGGMRSKSVATFLEFAGIPAIRLDGGYRAYRQYILEELPHMLPEKAIVLHGMTGVGKTDILLELEKKGYPILDLEALANHRGSVFGSIGLDKAHNQKKFDALLFHSLQKLQACHYFIMEAESKRIGSVSQPEELLEKKIEGIHITIETSMEQRVERIYKEYIVPFEKEEWFHENVVRAFERIEKRVKNEDLRNEIKEHLNNKSYKEIIEPLLTYYYDPRYEHKLLDYKGPFYEINVDNLGDAVHKLIRLIKNITEEKILGVH